MVSKLLCIAALIITLPIVGWAQEDEFDAPPSKERLQERVERVRKMRLLDVLNLQGQQVERFFSVYNPAQQSVLDRKRALDAAGAELRDAVGRDADEQTLSRLTENVLAAMTAFEAAVNKRHADVRTVLTPKQYAAYMAFEALFQEELMRTVLRRARERR